MRLSAAQQERYARHLLLDDFGGEGQERALQASVAVRGAGVAARWAARYLAASGIGRLSVEVPAWEAELRGLSPSLELGGECTRVVSPEEEASVSGSAQRGALAAAALLRQVCTP